MHQSSQVKSSIEINLPKKPFEENKSISRDKPIVQSTSVFGAADEDESESLIPRGAKLSKNIGRETPTSLITKTYARIAGTITNWNTESKQHPLHRPIEKFFSDKQEQQKKIELEVMKEKIIEKSLEETKLNELYKIKDLIKAEKNRVKICLLCKRKFANMDHLTKHEKSSEMHKTKKLKI